MNEITNEDEPMTTGEAISFEDVETKPAGNVIISESKYDFSMLYVNDKLTFGCLVRATFKEGTENERIKNSLLAWPNCIYHWVYYY